jgi:prophage DNA circulation protein
MALSDSFKGGSWRGVEFFYKSTAETRGFKNSVQMFAGSDNFRVEQMGRMPRQFVISMQVKDENRDSFDTALNTSGSGILLHPKYGNFTAKVTQYSKSDTTDNYGLYDYTVTFVIEFGLIVPTLSVLTTAGVSALRSQAVTSASSFAKDKLKGFGF